MGVPTKVLYIEDDRSSQRLVQTLLNSCGYEVIVAPAGREGISLANKLQPSLVLLDISLPDMPGMEVSRHLRNSPTTRSTPIVALTAHTQQDIREKVLAAGVDGFLTKPINASRFPQQIASFIQQQPAYRMADNTLIHLEEQVRAMESMPQLLGRINRVKHDFVTLASHELRTPLALVSGYARLLEQELKQLENELDTKSLMLAAEKLTASVARMQQVVEEIIRVSQINTGSLMLDVGVVNMAHLLAEITNRFGPDLQVRKLKLHLEDMSELPVIRGDEQQIKTAVSHLVQNAIKFTPDGGDIWICGRSLENAIHIAIKDNGIGIPNHELPYIFDQFYTLGTIEHHTSNKSVFKGGGLGLGLTIVRGIVEAHNGRIWVESTTGPQSGTTFHLLFPLNVNLN